MMQERYMISFIQYISELTNIIPSPETTSTTAKRNAQKSRVSQRKLDSVNRPAKQSERSAAVTPDDEADHAQQVLFLRKKRRGMGDKLVNFSSPAFTHGFKTAAADAAMRRWATSDGKRPGHLSKEP